VSIAWTHQPNLTAVDFLKMVIQEVRQWFRQLKTQNIHKADQKNQDYFGGGKESEVYETYYL